MIGSDCVLLSEKGTFDLSSTKVLSNVAYSFVSQIVRLAANTLLFVSVARIYSNIEFGYFATAHTYYTFFLLLADFGIDSFIISTLPANIGSRSTVLHYLIRTRLLFCLIAIIGMLFFGIFISSSTDTIILFAIFTIGLIGTTFTSFFISTLKSVENFQYEIYINLLQNGFLLIGLFIVGFAGVDYIYLAILFSISRYLGLIKLYRVFKEIANQESFIYIGTEIYSTIRKVFPYGIHLFFGTLYFTSDTMIIALMYGEFEVGQYQAVFKLMLFTLMFSDVLTVSALPTLSKLYINDRQEWRFVGNIIFKMLAVSGIIFGGIFFYLSEETINIVYGSNVLINGKALMQIFGVLIFVRSCTLLHGFILTSSQNQYKRMVVTIVATFINIGLNVLVLPEYGIVGSAYVALVTNTVVGILFIVLSRNLQFNMDRPFVIAVIAFSLLYFSLSYFIQTQLLLRLVVVFSLGSFLFYTLYYLLSNDEVHLITSFFYKLKSKIGV